MSGAPTKGKKRDTTPTGEPFVPQKPAPVITQVEEAKPPRATPVIVRCKDCFWGQDFGIGQRRCRRNPPFAQYRHVHGARGELAADPMWPRVHEEDYCGEGTPLP